MTRKNITVDNSEASNLLIFILQRAYYTTLVYLENITYLIHNYMSSDISESGITPSYVPYCKIGIGELGILNGTVATVTGNSSSNTSPALSITITTCGTIRKIIPTK